MAKDELIKRATDIWCLYGQAINKAFEFNGLYWHSELFKVHKNKISEDQFAFEAH